MKVAFLKELLELCDPNAEVVIQLSGNFPENWEKPLLDENWTAQINKMQLVRDLAMDEVSITNKVTLNAERIMDVTKLPF